MSPWTPILPPYHNLMQEASTAIEAIVRSVLGPVETISLFSPGPASVCDSALLSGYIGLSHSDNRAFARAAVLLNSAAADGENIPDQVRLFGGLCGLGWLRQHLSTEADSEQYGSAGWAGEMDVGANDRIDLNVLHHLQGGLWSSDYDLINGLVGIGVYFLERWPAGYSGEGIRLVLQHLSGCAEYSYAGITWHTGPHLLPEWQRNRYPNGYYNIGVAHGLPGVLYFLSVVATLGIENQQCLALLEGAVNWLLAHRCPPGSRSEFPAVICDGNVSESRFAWCYGDLGILSVLLQVSSRVNREDWREFALRLLDRCIYRSSQIEETSVKDAYLCHGAAGVAHIFNRIYQNSHDIRCHDAAITWYSRALELLALWGTKEHSASDTTSVDAQNGSDASPHFLDGAIGVALALLAATTPIEPNWDRMLLMSSRLSRRLGL